MNSVNTAVRPEQHVRSVRHVADYPQPMCPACKGTSFYGQPVELQIPARTDDGRGAGEHAIVLVSCATRGAVVGSYRLQPSFGGVEVAGWALSAAVGGHVRRDVAGEFPATSPLSAPRGFGEKGRRTTCPYHTLE